MYNVRCTEKKKWITIGHDSHSGAGCVCELFGRSGKYVCRNSPTPNAVFLCYFMRNQIAPSHRSDLFVWFKSVSHENHSSNVAPINSSDEKPREYRLFYIPTNMTNSDLSKYLSNFWQYFSNMLIAYSQRLRDVRKVSGFEIASDIVGLNVFDQNAQCFL